MSDKDLRGGERPGLGGESPGLRYSRERRLERASPEVRWLNSRYGAKKPGLLKSLFATRASSLLFLTILGLVVAFLLVPLFEGVSKKGGRIGEARFSASALYFEDRVLVAVSRTGGPESAGDDESLVVLAEAEGGAGPRRFEFPFGARVSGDYRLALDSPGRKPKRVALRLSLGGASLDLVLPVD
ncbi:MAG TPA: hypothetical protein P5165_08035 [Spirochaetia bacterium]|nr:hypothetical protein [Spirochaetales bacterium]HRY73158.1 hypothetical protein [Spirochaetia bacterium]